MRYNFKFLSVLQQNIYPGLTEGGGGVFKCKGGGEEWGPAVHAYSCSGDVLGDRGTCYGKVVVYKNLAQLPSATSLASLLTAQPLMNKSELFPRKKSSDKGVVAVRGGCFR